MPHDTTADADLILARAREQADAAIAGVARLTADLADRDAALRHADDCFRMMRDERDRAIKQAAEWRGEAVEQELAARADPTRPADAARLLAAMLLVDGDRCPCCRGSVPCDLMGATGDSVVHAGGCPMPVLLSRAGMMGPTTLEGVP